MKNTCLSLTVLFLLISQLLFARKGLEAGNDKRTELENSRQNHLAALLESDNSSPDTEIASGKKISPAKAILFSAIIPGSGQAYARSWKKAIVFFAVEVTGIVVNMTYNKKGDDKQDVMKDYAHTYWSEQKYWNYLYYEANPSGQVTMDPNTWFTMEEIMDDMDAFRDLEGEHSHTLPSTKTQQYYEMIGKYVGQFGYGWEDADFDDDLYGYDRSKITPYNIEYVNMRKKSEDFYDTATKASQFVIFNHLLSAVDAGFSAKIRNRRIDVALKGDIKMVRYNMTEFVGLAINF